MRSFCLILCISQMACAKHDSESRKSKSALESPHGVHRRGRDNANAMIRYSKLCESARGPNTQAACRRACFLNHSNSCTNWGHLLKETSPHRSIDLFSRACDGGSGTGCKAYAYALESTAPDTADAYFRKARDYLRVHCSQNHALSCSQLAALYEAGLGGAADRDTASEFRARACQLGTQSDCSFP